MEGLYGTSYYRKVNSTTPLLTQLNHFSTHYKNIPPPTNLKQARTSAYVSVAADKEVQAQMKY